jgi:hypothetical protein
VQTGQESEKPRKFKAYLSLILEYKLMYYQILEWRREEKEIKVEFYQLRLCPNAERNILNLVFIFLCTCYLLTFLRISFYTDQAKGVIRLHFLSLNLFKGKILEGGFLL